MGNAIKRLASWRRKGKGVWRITLIIDGYDEVFELLYPGGLSKTFVEGAARMELAISQGERRKYVHVTKMVKEDEG